MLPESHPRQWVDRSSPAYRRRHPRCSPNPTHGSGWIVQVRPTDAGTRDAPRIPPTAVGGSFKSGLHHGAQGFLVFLFFFPLASRERNERGGRLSCRLDLNDPPTSVGGIRGIGRAGFVSSVDLHDPPTSVCETR